MQCPHCSKGVNGEDGIQAECEDCDQWFHVANGDAYPIPVISRGLIVEGRHPDQSGSFLNSLDEAQPSGHIRTRRRVIMRLAGESENSKSEAKYDAAIEKFNGFGLDVTRIETKETVRTALGDHTTIIRRIGEPDPSFDWDEVGPDQNPETIGRKKVSDWILGQCKTLYPEYEPLYPEQRDAIKGTLDRPGGLTIVALPTGYGKTRIAQLSFLSLINGHGDRDSVEGPTLVISPTISLMDDQRTEWSRKFKKQIEENNPDVMVRGNELRGNELKVKFMTTGDEDVKEGGIATIKRDLITGEIDVLCCSPERLFTTSGSFGMMEVIRRMGGEGCALPFSMLVIDEIHILYDWGDSIRPEFLLLHSLCDTLRRANPNLRTLLMSATISDREEKDLVKYFGRNMSSDQEPLIVRKKEVRKDIAFSIVKCKHMIDDDEHARVARKLFSEYDIGRFRWRKHEFTKSAAATPPLLVYTAKPDRAEAIKKLSKKRFGSKCKSYTGSTKSQIRAKILDEFKRDMIPVLAATSAFGMGVNKGNVWLCGYVGQPWSVRELYQSFGRAARKSGWHRDDEFDQHRNGNCIWLTSGGSRMTYKPNLRTDTTIERLWDMIARSINLGEGFYLIPMVTKSIFWDPFDEEDLRRRNRNKDAHKKKLKHYEEERRKYWQERIGMGHPGQKDEVNKSIKRDKEIREAELIKEALNESFSIRSQEDVTRKKRIIAILEKADYWDFVGFFPENPIDSDNHGTLEDMFADGGLEGLEGSFREIDGDSVYTNNSERAFALMRCKKPLSSIEDLRRAVREGIGEAEKWHDQNQDDLDNFRNSNNCIRKRFAGIVGAKEDEITSCEDWYKGDAPRTFPPPMPCSVCRSRLYKEQDNGWEHDFDEKNPSIWLTTEELRIMCGIEPEKDDHAGTIRARHVGDLPADGYQFGRLMPRTQLSFSSHNDQLHKLLDDLKPVEENGEKQVYEVTLYDVNGESPDSGIKMIITRHLLNGHPDPFREIGFAIQPAACVGKIYGFLFFAQNGDCMVRGIRDIDVKAAFLELRKEMDDLHNNFIGPGPFVQIGEENETWKEYSDRMSD